MSSLQLPPCPASLRSIQHYLKTATEHETRDPVITYWCRLYSLESALKIDSKSDEARAMLVLLVQWLEKQKKVFADNEAVTNDIAAQAHVENYALQLFAWADGQDRAGVFNKNVVKAFYTAGMLMDVLTTFGELPEDIATNCKYAKWKAAYIHNCLKNGETPVPGPVGWEESNENEDNQSSGAISRAPPPQNNIGFDLPQLPPGNGAPPGGNMQPGPYPQNPGGQFPQPPNMQFPQQPSDPPLSPNINYPADQVNWKAFNPNVPDMSRVSSANPPDERNAPSLGSSHARLEPAQITKAQKYCKFATSALNYDDIPEAINNLQKALRLLQTGQDN